MKIKKNIKQKSSNLKRKEKRVTPIRINNSTPTSFIQDPIVMVAEDCRGVKNYLPSFWPVPNLKARHFLITSTTFYSLLWTLIASKYTLPGLLKQLVLLFSRVIYDCKSMLIYSVSVCVCYSRTGSPSHQLSFRLQNTIISSENELKSRFGWCHIARKLYLNGCLYQHCYFVSKCMYACANACMSVYTGGKVKSTDL